MWRGPYLICLPRVLEERVDVDLVASRHDPPLALVSNLEGVLTVCVCPDARKKVKKEEPSPAVAAQGPGPSKELTSAISITANGNGRQLPKGGCLGSTEGFEGWPSKGSKRELACHKNAMGN